MFCAGLGNGLGAGLTLGQPATVARLTLAALAYLPALAVVAAIAALAVALRAPWIAWLAVTFVITTLYLGALLRLPRWLLELSPVGQTTRAEPVPRHGAGGNAHRRNGFGGRRGLDLSQPRRGVNRTGVRR